MARGYFIVGKTTKLDLTPNVCKKSKKKQQKTQTEL